MRSSRAGSGTAVVIAIMASAMGTGVSAHRLDEYLQAARIEIGADRIELELALTPGIAIAGGIIAEIDRDRDGSLSLREQQVYATRVLSGIDLEADGRPLAVHPIASSFPDVDAVRRGEGTIRLRSEAVLPPQLPGAHRLLFRNTHRRDVSVYLANALVPVSPRLGITAQRRDIDQRELTIDYVLDAAAARSMIALLLIAIAAATLAMRVVLHWPRRSRRSSSDGSIRSQSSVRPPARGLCRVVDGDGRSHLGAVRIG